ncbi:MAG: hypothetical protein K2X77_07040 [Candidatus Obscuribacterales bacterium]|nr:hypothetical protein [Candidatus Obscuribacterales bacterium]
MDAGHDDELVKLRIDGPGGPAVVVLTKDMPLEVLKQVLDAKAVELRAGASQREPVGLPLTSRSSKEELLELCQEYDAGFLQDQISKRQRKMLGEWINSWEKWQKKAKKSTVLLPQIA